MSHFPNETGRTSNLNTGHHMENVAYYHLLCMYDTVTRAKYQSFYDYSVTLNGVTTLIEVKWFDCNAVSASLNLRWEQMQQLFAAGDFLIYLMTQKGNVFITPQQIMDHAHVHYNQLNRHQHRLYMRMKYEDGKFAPAKPDNCRFCHGGFTNYFGKCTTSPKFNKKED